MNYLVRGGESKERVKLLLKLTRVNSENVVDAIIDHLFTGHSESHSAALNDITQSNFNRAMSRLNEVAGTVEAIKELDWDKFKSVNR